MKKKLGIILAILLCTVLIFTLVACGDKSGGEQAGEGEAAGDSLEGVSAEAKASVESNIETFIDKWLSNHGEMEITDQSAALRKALVDSASEFKQKDKNGKQVAAKTPTVTFDAATSTYTIVYSWQKSSYTKTFTKKAQQDVYKNWAGYNLSDFDFQDDDDASTEIADQMIAGVVKAVNDITENAVKGKFGAKATVGIDVAGKTYGLLVKGNVDVNNKAGNEIGLALVNMETGKEIGGIYYDAAATAKDSKLYIQYSETVNGQKVYKYKYLDYFDIFGWIGDKMPKAKTEAGKKVFKLSDGSAPTTLAAFLSAIGAGDYADLIAPAVSGMLSPYKDGDVYLLDLNLGDVMTQVSDIVSGLGVNFSFLDNIGLELDTMYGLKGHISLSAKMKDGALSDFQIAINIPECTFHFSDKQDAFSVNIPAISFAINVKDYEFVYGDKTIPGVIPAEAATKAEKFSPTNVKLSGDVYVKYEAENDQEQNEVKLDSTFHFDFVTDVSVPEIISEGYNSTARGVLSIKQSGDKGDKFVDTEAKPATNFLTISYEQALRRLTVSGTAFEDENGTGTDLYTFYITDKKEAINALKDWIGLLNYWGLNLTADGIVIDETKTGSNGQKQIARPVAKRIFEDELVKAIMAHYMAYGRSLVAEPETTDSDKGDDVAAAAFTMSDIGDYFDAFKTLYEKYIKEGKIDVTVEGGFAFKAEVTKAMIDEVIDTINKTFETTIPKTNDAKYGKYYPEYANVYINDENHKNKCVVEVLHDGILYTVTFDNSQEKKFEIEFKMVMPEKKDAAGKVTSEKRTYVVSFVAETLTKEEGSWKATVIVNVLNKADKSVKKTTVSLSNFHAKWGDNFGADIDALIPAQQKDGEGNVIGEIALFSKSGDGPALVVVDAVLDILGNDNIKPVAKKLGNFIVEKVAEKQVEDAKKAAANNNNNTQQTPANGQAA